MKREDVLKMKWVNVKNWSEMSTLNRDCIERNDIIRFVENLMKDTARRLEIPYEELSNCMISENSAFYATLNRIFVQQEIYQKNDHKILALQSMFRMPDVDYQEEDGVKKCLRIFKGLSDSEKVMFLNQIGYVKVKVTCTGFSDEERIREK